MRAPGDPRHVMGGEKLLAGRKRFVDPSREGHLLNARPIENLDPGLVDGHGELGSCGSGRSETSCHAGVMMAEIGESGSRSFAEISAKQTLCMLREMLILVVVMRGAGGVDANHNRSRRKASEERE